MSEKLVKIEAEIPESLLRELERLAEKRGHDANTVLQQAIVNESYFDKKVSQGAKILLEEDNSIKKLDLS